MPITVSLVLVVLALLLTIAAGMGRAPLFVAVLLLTIIELRRCVPPR
jgi:hypothetical protein